MSEILFSYEHGDLQAYGGLDDLISKVEKVDVENGEYVFWDAGAQEYTLDPGEWPRPWGKVSPSIIRKMPGKLGREAIVSIMADYCGKYGLMPLGEGPEGFAETIFAFQRRSRSTAR